MPYIHDSILDSTKKILGLEWDFTNFDIDVIMAINTTFSALTQLGVGPEDGFEIDDRTTLWSDYLGVNKKLNLVKTYVYLRVRMLWDPPATSFDITAKQEQIKELEFRINVEVQSQLVLPDGSTYSAGAFMWELEGDNVWPKDAKSGDVGIYPASGNVWRKS